MKHISEHGNSYPRLSYRNIILLYSLTYLLITFGIHLAFFPIGDIDVESDFYGHLAESAKSLKQGNFSVANYPYKGPVYSFALVCIHFFVGDWYRSGVILNVLCAAGSLLLIFHLISRVFESKVALLTTISVSLLYEYFMHAHKASSDILFLFLCYCSISMLFMDRFSLFRVILGGILGALAFLTRYNGVFLPFALIMMLFINPSKWSRKQCSTVFLLYLTVFLAVCSPWFIMNIKETGSLLETRNIENIVKEFYGGGKSDEIPPGGFTSMLHVFKHDPIFFIKHYATNIAKHFWMDMTSFLGLETGILVIFGIIGLLFIPPTRKQWGYLVFPGCYLLVICLVFYLRRLSLLLAPAYYAILYCLLLRFGGLSLFPSRESMTGKISTGADQEEKKMVRGFTFEQAVMILIIVTLFGFQIMRIIKIESVYYDRRPLFVLEAAQFLRDYSSMRNNTEKRIVMARKPHIAHYSDLIFQYYPQSVSNIGEFLSFARRRGVNYIVFSDIERRYYKDSEAWQRLGKMPSVNVIYSKPKITIYEVAE